MPMNRNISNLIFSGGGILGISYLGALDYLYQNNLMNHVKRTAGTSAGAIAACITSFQLSFEEIKGIADSLDYRKVISKTEASLGFILPEEINQTLETVFGDLNSLYRLATSYGWFSSSYFYHWIRGVIKEQFNQKKLPPYTFQDFQNPSLHKNNRSFYDLYVIGSNLTTGTSQVFSYDTTPTMEVAQAIRISMSIPLFFEAVMLKDPKITGNSLTNVFCDGGLMNNYPIRLFDSYRYNPKLVDGANMESLGIRFLSASQPKEINNLLDYITRLALASGYIQQEDYRESTLDQIRSISIDTMNISALDFNITTGDSTYQQLYRFGYYAAEDYFT